MSLTAVALVVVLFLLVATVARTFGMLFGGRRTSAPPDMARRPSGLRIPG